VPTSTVAEAYGVVTEPMIRGLVGVLRSMICNPPLLAAT